MIEHVLTSAQRKSRLKVIVLGAGLSGLTTAYYLRKHNVDVYVLEARNRLGGRVDTRRIDEAEHLTVEMGAEWIGKTHTKMQQLCRELRLPLADHRLKTSLLYNHRYYKPSEWRLSSRYQHTLRRLILSVRHLTPGEVKTLDAMDWWHYLISNHIATRDLDILDLIDSTDYGESTRFVSAYDILLDRSVGGGTNVECYYAIRGGNDRLPLSLAAKIGRGRIRLSHEATAIIQEPNGVEITCKNKTSWRADIVVVTLPAYAITQIQWSPAIPKDQFLAFSSLDYCRIMKNAILFSHRFWDEPFEMITDTQAHHLYHATQNQPGKKGALISYTTGDEAYILSKMGSDEITAVVTHALRKPLGDVDKEVDKVMSYYWGDDPYTRGAFAIFEKNYPLDLQQIMRHPLGRIHFAGEHTAPTHGFMEGAVESGEKVAAEILARGYY